MYLCLPVAVTSLTVTSTMISFDATSLSVILTDNELSPLATKYSDCSNDTTT